MEQQNKIISKNPSTIWKSVEQFAERQPKRTFYLMFGLIFLSTLFSIGSLIYIQKVSIPEYETMKKQNVLKDAATSFNSPFTETEKILGIREALKELDYYRKKKILSSSDSSRIKYLLDKYNINNSR
ncbi:MULTISPECIES: hypothetical protein [Chryseobacterium group]|jgi:hypothetical protein|uniref:Uncharacterized protein n=4 Tax=Chryseobacterium TaxID=59732 RepID=A0AAJ1VK78_9FLAO|nr:MULTISPECIES: hypothetical protein [Chryseobacterium group]EFK33186.1 hypothetical protein HMPREF0204_12254 [Chryseobacterium gleum ATCC 35910]MDN4013278.1 hypothetical protein [Chryseobacterium gambrini]MDN4028868.1 hypothetical protein [Chryseobacterium gambrini]MDO3425162.1 hypothetical protein [Chryseobacterium sp. APV1]QQY33995.1 hypothetical protein I6I60_09625 [Chryseobacterium gleum]